MTGADGPAGGPPAYHLGVDLGTTYTAAAVRVGGSVEVVRLGGQRPEVPSLVFLRPDGGVLVGESAERRGEAEPGRLARDVKRRLGDPVPLLVGGAPYPAQELLAHLLRLVLDTVAQRYDGPPATVTLTHPAIWGPYKRDLLEQAARSAGLPTVTLRPEPEAAAIHYAAGERVRSGDTLAVYDLGGGTFDAAVLRKSGTGFTLLGEPEGIERLGGVDFDEAVFEHVTTALGGALTEALGAAGPDDERTLTALARLRRDCLAAKEALTFDTEVMIPVALPGLHTRVRLNRAEFEAMISPALATTVAALGRALRSAGVAPDELSAIVLAGGSSRIPLVGQVLGAEFGRPVALDPHPEHSIALGAAAPPAAAPPEPAPDDTPPAGAPVTTADPGRTGDEAPARPALRSAAAPADPAVPAAPAAGVAGAGGALTRLRAAVARLGGRPRWVLGAVAAVVALVGVPAAVLAIPAASRQGSEPPDVPPGPITALTTAAPAQRWVFDAGEAIAGRPAATADRVFAGAADGMVYAVDRVSGLAIWRVRAGAPVRSAPVVRSGVVYATTEDGWLYALDADDGGRRWRARAGQGDTSSPALAGDTVVVGGGGAGLYGFDLDGDRRWRMSGRFSATPAVAGGVAFAASEDGRLISIDARTGDTRWSVRLDRRPSGPATAGDAVVVAAGDLLSARDAATNRERWTVDAQVGSAPLGTGTAVYVSGVDGSVRALDAATGAELWRSTVAGAAGTPAIAGDTLIVAGSAGITALDAATGARRWEYRVDGAAGGTPRIANGDLFVGSADGRLYALRLPPGTGEPPPDPMAPPARTPTPTTAGPARTPRRPQSTSTTAPPADPTTAPPTTPPPPPSASAQATAAISR